MRETFRASTPEKLGYMRRWIVFLVSSLTILSAVIILLATIRQIQSANIPNLQSTPTICADMPDYDPGQYVVVPTIWPQPANPKLKYAAVFDLDPTIPIASKAAIVVRRVNGDYEYAFYATDEQREEYLKSLRIGDCLATIAPPACLMGHYPGEPPGREPCIVATPKAKSPVPIFQIK